MSTHRNTLIGMCCVALGQLCFIGINTVVKLLLDMQALSVLQIATVRYSVGSLFSFTWWYCKQPPDTEHWYGDSPYTLNIWMRAFFWLLMAISLFYAESLLPLGDALCIFNHAPLLSAFAAYCILGENLPNIFVFVSACILASAGITLLSQPTFITGGNQEALNIVGLTSIFVSVAAYCTACLLVRTAKSAHVVQLEMVNNLQAIIVWIPLWSAVNQFAVKNETMGTVFTSYWPSEIRIILMLIAAGISGFCGVLFSTLGYQYGEATKVAFLEYVEIPLLFVVQAIVFNDAPNTYEILGAVMVTVGCLLPVCEQYYRYKRSTAVQYEQVEQIWSTEDEQEDSHAEK